MQPPFFGERLSLGKRSFNFGTSFKIEVTMSDLRSLNER